MQTLSHHDDGNETLCQDGTKKSRAVCSGSVSFVGLVPTARVRSFRTSSLGLDYLLVVEFKIFKKI